MGLSQRERFGNRLYAIAGPGATMRSPGSAHAIEASGMEPGGLPWNGAE
jgi:hypothetical protein